MKKTLLIIFLLMAARTISVAQSSSAFSNGDNLFNAGIGIGTPFFGSGYSSSLPVNPTISYERGITDQISVGAQLSYASSKYSFDDGFGDDYSFTESAVYVGARGSYHFGEQLGLDSKFDVYGGVSAGYVVVTVSDNEGDSDTGTSKPGFGAFAGGKYFFQPKLGVYAEVGYQSLSYLNIGLAFKF